MMRILFFIGVIVSTWSLNAWAVERVGKSPVDFGVVNQERILYWLEKRGQLSATASDTEKAIALNNYLSKKSFSNRPIPGYYGKKIAAAKLFKPQQGTSTTHTKKGLIKVAPSQLNISKNDVETTVKVLAIMVDFPDLKHNANSDIGNQDVSKQHYEDLLFATDRPTSLSAYQYYQQESGGTFYFTGEAHGWVTADNDAAHYGANDPENNDDDMDVPALVTEAVTKAVSELNVDLSEFDLTDLNDVDNDGIFNEPDGIIDHVMIFHASIGEEAGGGSLGEDAIWSHRYYVFDDNYQPVSIPGSDIKLYGYTINPIDAKTGVVVHEFGHDLGLDDEYDTNNGLVGSPVGDWSLMASGSWVGGGSAPSSFSTLALDYLSTRYQGNWINQRVVNFDSLASENIALVHANNHDGTINQVRVDLGRKQTAFSAPYEGSYQYYSGKGNKKDNRLSFSVDLPSDTATLTMIAHWKIEQDWDYLQVLVNGAAIAGNHTKLDNEYWDINHFISGNSSDIDGAQGELSWVELSFDLAGYENQSVTIEIAYITDEAVGYYGFAADNITVSAGETTLFTADGEVDNEVMLAGFNRITQSIEGEEHHYYIQLRSHSGNDKELDDDGYDPGVLLWYRDDNVANNRTGDHPGEVFIGVVDADQNLIKSGSSIKGTYTQIRDAAFSLYDQSSFSSDSHLINNAKFSDKDDYSSPAQPESGINLQTLGFAMEVVTQASNSASATINIAKQDIADIDVTHDGLTISLSIDDPEYDGVADVTWNLGDGTELVGKAVSHTYASAGDYQLTASYTATSGNKLIEKSVIVGEVVTAVIDAQVNGSKVSFNVSVGGGYGELTYRWNFGDGSDLSQSKNPHHEYDSEGSYTVTLKITDATLQTFVFTTDIEVSDLEPLNASMSVTRSGLTATFTSTVTGGDGTYSYDWDFGDGNSASTANPSHTYSSAGSYSVKLMVTDGRGATDEVTVNVSVSNPVTTPTSSGGSSGGGSLGILALMLLGCVRLARS